MNRTTEIVLKILFYFLLPMLITFSDNLADIKEIVWDTETIRKLILLPLIGGLIAVKGFISKSYATFTYNSEEKKV